jgi:hypothetical protein
MENPSPRRGDRGRYLTEKMFPRYVLYVVFFAALTGCAKEHPMVQLKSGQPDDALGVEAIDNSAIESAKVSHSENNPYRNAYDSPDTYDTWINDKNGGGAYGDLNYKLHDNISDVLREHFREVPIPHGFAGSSDPDDRYSAFTYQNWDWFDPTCQVHVQIVAHKISRELLGRLQSLLVDDCADWCIVLLASADRNFDNRYELLIFADSVKVPQGYMAEYAE